MNYALNLNTSLHSIFWPKEDSLAKRALLIFGGVVLLAIASQLSIPLEPVPLTFQSITVILIGMACGARYGSYIIAAYYFAGICGFPVFADWSFGISKFFGPTGGYLLGFLPAAALSGYLAQQGFAKHFFGSLIAGCLGVSIIFLFGVSVLSNFIGGWQQAITLGLMPFIVSEPIKLICLSFLIPRCWKHK